MSDLKRVKNEGQSFEKSSFENLIDWNTQIQIVIFKYWKLLMIVLS